MAIFLSFWVHFIYVGMFTSFAEFFAILVTSFDSNYAFFGFVGTSVAAVTNFLGPLPQMAVEAFSYPAVISVLGVMLFLAFFMTSFDVYEWEFVFTYTLLFGVTAGFLFQNAMTLVYDACDPEEVGWAMGVATAGAGMGYAGFSCLAAYFVVVNEILSWREMFRIFAYSGLSVTLAGIMSYFFLQKNIETRYCDIPDQELASMSESEPMVTEEGSSKKENKKYGYELLFSGDANCWKLFVSNFLLFMVDLVPIKFSLIYAYAVTGDINVYYYIPLAMGIGTVVVRIVTNTLTGMFSPHMVNMIINASIIVCCLVLAYASNIGAIIFFLALYSGLNSSLYPILVLRTTEILGTYQYARNIGVQFLAVGCAALCGGAIGGAIYDATDGDMTWVFLMCTMVFSVALLFDLVAFDWIRVPECNAV